MIRVIKALKSNKGFTLIETLISLVLVTFVAMVSSIVISAVMDATTDISSDHYIQSNIYDIGKYLWVDMQKAQTITVNTVGTKVTLNNTNGTTTTYEVKNSGKDLYVFDTLLVSADTISLNVSDSDGDSINDMLYVVFTKNRRTYTVGRGIPNG